MLLRSILIVTLLAVLSSFDVYSQEWTVIPDETDAEYIDSIAIYFNKGEIVKAIRYGKSSLKEAALITGADSYELYTHYWKLANLFVEVEEYMQSRTYLHRAIYLLESNEEAAFIIDNYWNELARLYSQLAHIGFYSYMPAEEAFSYYGKAIDLVESEQLKCYITFSFLLDKGGSCLLEFDFECANHYYLQVDSIWRNNPQYHQDPEFNLLRGETMALLGLYYQRKDDFEPSRHYYNQYVQNWEQYSKGRNRPRVINILMRTAETFIWEMHKKTSSDSMIYYTQLALLKACKSHQSLDLDDLPTIGDFYDLLYSYDILKQLARTIQQRAFLFGDESDKIRNLEIAIDIVSLSDQLHYQTLRKVVELRQGESQEIIRHSLFTYQAGVGFCELLYEIKPDDSIIEKAFYFTQRMKSQQLWLASAQNNANNELLLPDSLLKKERTYLDTIHYWETRILKAQQLGDKEKERSYKYNNLFHSQLAHEDFLINISKKYREYWAARWEHIPVTIRKLRQQLQTDELLIEYTGNDVEVTAFAITKDQPPRLFRITKSRDEGKEKVEHIHALNRLIRGSPMLRSSSRQAFIRSSNILYDYLIAPFTSLLDNKKRLIIIGNGNTHYLPFEVLLPSDELKPFNELEYLIKSYDISYHYSSTLLVESRQRKSYNKDGVFAFAPVYDDKDRPVLNPTEREQRSTMALRAFNEDGQYKPLPESEKEVTTIISLFNESSSGQYDLVLRSSATESALKKALESPYRYIHIAGHSFADLEHPKFSGIACYQEERKVSEDGILHTGKFITDKFPQN
jgi:CHAT domain-containing protein